jgi:hypothetical protein
MPTHLRPAGIWMILTTSFEMMPSTSVNSHPVRWRRHYLQNRLQMAHRTRNFIAPGLFDICVELVCRPKQCFRVSPCQCWYSSVNGLFSIFYHRQLYDFTGRLWEKSVHEKKIWTTIQKRWSKPFLFTSFIPGLI